MCRKLILSIPLVLLLVNSVFAAKWTNDDPADSLWSTPGNWQGNSIPVLDVTTYLEGVVEGPTIQDGINATTGRLRGPAYDPGDLMTMTMTGGTLTCSSTWEIAEEGGTGVVNMYGGSVSSTVATNDDCLHLGGYGHATFNMYGGTLTMTADMQQPLDTPGTGILNIYGGTFQVGQIFLSTNANRFGGHGLINIHKTGTLVLVGDDTADVEAWIDAWDLIAYDGKGTILYSYDSQADLTIVTAEEGPRYAYRPSPGGSVEDVQPDVILRWWPGWEAADPNTHDVYFGTDFNDVNDANTTITLGVYKGSQNLDANSYEPGFLDFGETYYWRIDEVNDANGDTWKGNVWSFTVGRNVIVDDMESYDDYWNLIAYDSLTGTWIDGMTNETGALIFLVTAPNELPVHTKWGGIKSMEYIYDNATFFYGYYSEAEMPIAERDEDWTSGGVRALSLWFHGCQDNDPEQMYVVVSDGDANAIVRYGDYVDEDLNDLKAEKWQEWHIELEDLNDANLASIDSFYIGFGDRDNPQPGGFGAVYFDDIRLYPTRCVVEYGPNCDLTGDCIVDAEDLDVLADWWVDDRRFADDFNGVSAALLQVDVGDANEPNNLKPGWVLMTKDDYSGKSGAITWEDFAGTGIDITLDTGCGNCMAGQTQGGEPLVRDYFFAKDTNGPPDGDFFMTVGNLRPGDYSLTTYHNHQNGLIASVDVTGEVLTSVGDTNVPQTAVSYDANCGFSYVTFRATGDGDVLISYVLDPSDNSQVFFNGFVLEFFGEPNTAWYPVPPDLARNVGTDVVLSWRPGKNASSHDVYLGTDFYDVNDANTFSSEYKGSLDIVNTSYQPSGLEFGTTYHWRIDAVNDTNIWKGDVWGFSNGGLLAEYTFDTNACDSSSNGYDANLVGTADVNNGVLVLDGNDGYMELPPEFGAVNPFDGSGDFSIAMKFKMDVNDVNDVNGILISSARDNNEFNHAMNVFVRDDGTVTYSNWGRGSPVHTSTGWADGTWHNLVVTHEHSDHTITIYLDGEIDGEENVNPGIPDIANDTVIVGWSLETVYPEGQGLAGKFNGEIDDVRIYDRVLRLRAWNPDPADKAVDVSINKVLSWQAREDANSHDVYLGTNFYDVNDANTVMTLGVYKTSQALIDTTYDPCGLEFGTTYYWRIDEVDDGNTWKGRIWSFTVHDGTAHNPSPDTDANNMGTNVILSWSPAIDVNWHDVYFGTDFDDVNDANTFSSEYKGLQALADTTYDAGSFESLELWKPYYWRIDEVYDGTTLKGDVWGFTAGCAAARVLNADLNRDCLIDFKDYAALANEWFEMELWPYQPRLLISSTSGGSVTTPGEGKFWYDPGTVVSVVANAYLNYHFLEWTGTAVDAGKVANPNVTGTAVTMDADYTLHANFAIDQRTLDINSTDHGSVTIPGEGQFVYDHGTLVLIEATADPNYHFVEWTGTAVDADKVADTNAASTTVTVDANYTLWASFAIDQHTLDINSTDHGSVTIPGEGLFVRDHGTDVNIVAVADPNYHFVNWTGTAVDANKVADPNAASTTVTVDANYTLWASFAIDQHTLDINSTANGSVTIPGEGLFVRDHGTDVNIVAVADANYHFVNWTGTAVDANKVADPNAASTTVTVDANYTLWANFAIDQRTLDVNSTANGSVTTPGEGQFVYDHDTLVDIVAAADLGYHFVEWTGTGVNAGKVVDPNAASTAITMDDDYTLWANFAIDNG